MSALRWAGALMLAICGWCVGDALAQKLQAEVDALEDTVHLLEDIREEIAFRRQDLGRLCERLTQEGRLRTQNSRIQTALPPPALGKREAAWFHACFAGLGHTEAEQECQRLEQYANKFRMALAQCRAELKQRRALSRRLGLAAGLALGVLLL